MRVEATLAAGSVDPPVAAAVSGPQSRPALVPALIAIATPAPIIPPGPVASLSMPAPAPGMALESGRLADLGHPLASLHRPVRPLPGPETPVTAPRPRLSVSIEDRRSAVSQAGDQVLPLD